MLLGAVRAVRCDVCGAQAASYVLGLALQSLRVTFGVFGLGIAVLLLVRAVSPSHRHQPLLRRETDVLSPSSSLRLPAFCATYCVGRVHPCVRACGRSRCRSGRRIINIPCGGCRRWRRRRRVDGRARCRCRLGVRACVRAWAGGGLWAQCPVFGVRCSVCVIVDADVCALWWGPAAVGEFRGVRAHASCSKRSIRCVRVQCPCEEGAGRDGRTPTITRTHTV